MAAWRHYKIRTDSEKLCLYRLWVFYTFNQLTLDIRAFNAHDAFSGTAVTQEIDSVIPHNFLIHDGEFLMNIGFKNYGSHYDSDISVEREYHLDSPSKKVKNLVALE